MISLTKSVGICQYRRLTEDERKNEESDSFATERNAYSAAVYSGLDERGITPHCYGTFEFIPNTYPGVPSFQTLPWDSLLLIDEPVDALLMEYIPWEPLTCYNITTNIAEMVIETTKAMHSARLLHGDLENRHMLLSKDNQITFVSCTLMIALSTTDFEQIDFDIAMTAGTYDPQDLRYVQELWALWDHLYMKLVSLSLTLN